MGTISTYTFLLFPSLEKEWHGVRGLLKGQEADFIQEAVGERRRECGVSRQTGEVLLYSTGEYIRCPETEHSGKENEKQRVYTHV